MHDGVNFSVFSQHATSVELLTFDAAGDAHPSRVISLDPFRNRTGDYWHVFVPGLRVGQLYGFRVDGAFDPQNGHRFDREKLLFDPYGRCVAARNYDRGAARRSGPNLGTALKCIVTESRSYDWQGDMPLHRPFSQTVIYEMHVGGFTRNPNSGVSPERRGTFSGVIDKIPHLLHLGINAVELLPVFHFDPQDAPLGLSNYWGYNPLSFFAPHPGYCSRFDPLACLDEFKDMVKALHRAGIEVILDVVYNHTAEGPEDGPTLCYRGWDNSIYYILQLDRSRYADYSGCGNTLNANHPVVRRLIRDSVNYWVSTMHVDGLRFDLASILSRDEAGLLVPNAPVLSDLDTDPALAGTKLIAEPWDIQAYQLGAFADGNWKEWNGLFRDHVRCLVKGDNGMVRNLACRILGSPDLYERNRTTAQAVNFVTCHDGFTMNDLVSYNEKHNEANREQNRDGINQNFSWNCGCEGPSTDPSIERLRIQQLKNLWTITFLSVGIPMILMGDEVRRTQSGNNNAYCQNNEISWFDWSSVNTQAELFRFVRRLIRLRLNYQTGRGDSNASLTDFLRQSEIRWHGALLNQPDWSDDSHSLAVTISSSRGRRLLHLIFNAWWNAIEFRLPASPNPGGWSRLIDTALLPPLDIAESDQAVLVEGPVYLAQSRSTVVLSSEPRRARIFEF
jgi:isoamylase